MQIVKKEKTENSIKLFSFSFFKWRKSLKKNSGEKGYGKDST